MLGLKAFKLASDFSLTASKDLKLSAFNKIGEVRKLFDELFQ